MTTIETPTSPERLLSRKDIRILLHLLEQGEEAITENRNEYESETDETRKETEDRLRKKMRHIRTVLLSISERAKEE